jgi:peptidoglycan/LPS O-acetylase OafA/YrhL
MSAPKSSRRHDIDALRAIAFGLLILYHVGMFYVPWGWHVKSEHIAPWLQTPMMVLNQWRMPLVFLISGLAVNFLLGEGDKRRMSYGPFAWLRVKRLLVPLIFGMLLIVPPQAYFEALANGATEPGYPAFLWHYFTFQGWPEGAFAGSDPGITWNHLWYLPYLLFYTLVLAGLLSVLGRPMAALRGAFRRLRGLSLVLVPVALLMPIGIWIFPLFPYISHDLLTDGYAHAMYGTFFLYGYLLGRDPGLWAEMARLRWVVLPLAVSAFVLLRGMSEIAPGGNNEAFNTALTFVIYLNRWSWLLLVLGWGHHWLNWPMAWLNYANRAVYPWYVFHQTVIVVAGVWLSGLGLGPVVEPVVLVLLTVLGCAGGMYLVERWVPWLGVGVGLKSRRSSRRVRAVTCGAYTANEPTLESGRS